MVATKPSRSGYVPHRLSMTNMGLFFGDAFVRGRVAALAWYARDAGPVAATSTLADDVRRSWRRGGAVEEIPTSYAA